MTPFWQDVLLAAATTVFAWWFSTGLIFLIVRRGRKSYPVNFGVASLVAAGATIALYLTRDLQSVVGAYVGFFAALVLWGWHELSFLQGYITGRRAIEGPARTGIWHFRDAAMAVIYHEIAIFITALAMLWLLAGADNKIGLWTFVILWLMRLSAKLNIFLGVPNLNADLLPEHLRFLKNYFAKRPINLLFPFSIIIPTVLAGALLGHLASSPQLSFVVVGHTLLGTLIALAILEHWFLVLPISDSALWRWALKPKDPMHGPSDGPMHRGSNLRSQSINTGTQSGVAPLPAYQLPSSEGNRL